MHLVYLSICFNILRKGMQGNYRKVLVIMGRVNELYFLEDDCYGNVISLNVMDVLFLSREGRLDGIVLDDGYAFEEAYED